MAENLKTTKYADGTAIPLVTGNSNWNALTPTGKGYCWYSDDINNKATYGALYTWAAAMNGAASSIAIPSGVQGVCPSGWHLPSDAEWDLMENYLANNGYNYDGTTGGGRDKIAKALANTSGWTSSLVPGAVGATDFSTYRNKSGFTALAGGYRYYNGTFYFKGFSGFWWTTTGISSNYAWNRVIDYNNKNIKRGFYSDGDYKEGGVSVRCVKN